MALSFRKMEIGDIPAALAVRVSTVENPLTFEQLERLYGVTPRSLAQAMTSGVAGWICEDAGELVGFAMGDPSSGEILVVAVLPDHEDRGIGKELLRHVQAWLFGLGHEELWLLANPDPGVRAYGFYRKLGWHGTGRRKGEDEVMTLRRPDG